MIDEPSLIVREFLQAFLSGEIGKARKMMHDDFYFHAPMHDGRGGKEAYFAGAEKKATFIRNFNILRQWTDDDHVSTIYDLDLGTVHEHATIAMSEWHIVRDGKLASAFMVFDGNARAVRLMRDALRDQAH